MQWNRLSDRSFSSRSPQGGENSVAGRRDEVTITVPVAEERPTIRKLRRVTGAVQARTVIHEREEVLDVPVEHEEVVVERIAPDRLLDAPEVVRQEGETIVIPVHEEILVVEKRLKLVGEVRITRRRTIHQESH